MLSDGDLYLETLDIRANLLMCEEYDGATGFSEVIDLTAEQADCCARPASPAALMFQRAHRRKTLKASAGLSDAKR